MNILLTGGNGYIAKTIYHQLSNIFNIESITRDNFDLKDPYKTQKWFDNKYYDVVIHTAIKGGNRLIEDDCSVLNDNLKMFTNLEQCSNHYGKFITFGSGAEITSPNSFYGYSKILINKLINNHKNFFNLRIYAIFDENEEDRRFIKSNLLRYINKQSLIIHNNKYMDFIYTKDFISILKKFILEDNNESKTQDCVYAEKYSLLDIANIINNLNNYKVNIIVENNNNIPQYVGIYKDLNLHYLGLKNGILQTYKKLIFLKEGL